MFNKFVFASVTLYFLYYYKAIGHYSSKPYASSILLEPSEITTKLANDGKFGFYYSYDYIALFINFFNKDSKVYYLALPSKGEYLKDETYFNHKSRH